MLASGTFKVLVNFGRAVPFITSDEVVTLVTVGSSTIGVLLLLSLSQAKRLKIIMVNKYFI